MTDSLWAHRWRKELVRQSPILRLCISDENRGVVLHSPERMARVDLLGEPSRLRKRDCGNFRAVREIYRLAHIRRLDNGAIFAEKAVVVAQVVWKDLIETANKR